MKNKILTVAAHPDDEILGCGGTVARLIREGHEAYTLILGEGITARDKKRNSNAKNEDVSFLRRCAEKANKIIGVKELFHYELPDNRFDTVSFLDIVKIVEEVKNKIRPQCIFTHYGYDLNIDHRITYQSVLTATRPTRGEPVREIYSFEVLSSTEWKYPLTFSPNVFISIDKTLQVKRRALDAYQSEVRAYPHPRSFKGIKVNAECWGMKVGGRYVEAFMMIRSLR